MAKRSDISILLFFDRQMVRADFGKDISKPNFYLQETVDVESTLHEAIIQVTQNQPRLSNRTLVLSTDVWSQIVLLPKLSVSGIEPSDLEEVLKFEAETLSGIDIDEISLASTKLDVEGDYQKFWVSVIKSADLDAINEHLESLGCRDTLIAHPSGFARNTELRGNCETLEVWEDLVFHLTENSTRLEHVKQLSSDQLVSNEPVLTGSQNIEWDDEHATFEHLTEDTTAKRWAGIVADNYRKRLDSILAPRLRHFDRTPTRPIRHIFSGIIALLVVGFCFWHGQYAQQYNKSLQIKLSEIEAPAIQKKKNDSQLIQILEKRAEVETAVTALGDDLKRITFFLESQNNRFATLLELLIEMRTEDLVIEQVEGTEDGILISGVSLNGEAAQGLAKSLRERSVKLGWAVNPARQEGQQKLTTGGPWNYKILLAETGPFESAVQPRKKN
jgi:hypothetical protein